ncbi:hypothetical protein M011DRAFT_523586 [Sporormia fimetaria CBS 119925]|uniref:Uncharacterized protein n=1 Tax=Sporormia fimetaria CBS 119925 TaxID=1340428 RepID=A0A6A6VLC0_9PLEO|nr:hypothetical protein M011DRAFT_523586 [Sporormia fimetaria CBS 119925]
MNSAAGNGPISLMLAPVPSLQLIWGEALEFGVMKIGIYETNRAVTVVCPGLDSARKKLDLQVAVESELLELVEAGSNQRINLPVRNIIPNANNHLMIVPYQPHIWWFPVCVKIGVQSNSDLWWKNVLVAGKNYDLRIPDVQEAAWCYYSEDPIGPSQDVLQCFRHRVDGVSSLIRFQVTFDPTPPNLFATLALGMSHVCHLSGDPPFHLFITYFTDSKRVFTFNKKRTPISIFNVKTGVEMERPSQFGGFISEPLQGFPDDDDFVEISADRPWRFRHTLEKKGAEIGGLECLTAGTQYRVQLGPRVSGVLPSTSYSNWMYGSKRQTLGGSLPEKHTRWECTDYTRPGKLEVVVKGCFLLFKAVE